MIEQHEQVGLIGVGLLGTAVAERLLSSGHRVDAYDSRSSQLDVLAAMGGRRCRSVAEVLRCNGTVIMSLPDSSVSAEVLSQNADSLRQGQTIVDTTTGNPEEMVAIGEMLRARSVTYVEATVAGSSTQVRTGAACLFLGGDEDVVERIRGLFAAIASKHFHLGSVGSASRFKLVHNLVLGLSRVVLAEGLTFAESLGFDAGLVLEILKETPAASAVMESKGRKMVSGDREPQARLSQHLKDVRLIVAAAENAGAKIPLSHVHMDLLERAEALGFGDADNSAVIEAYRKPAEDSA
jgi:3-hydroxyisobutyrate dehydrogenase-like beta-hydroxyacid dehydrogenase